MIVSGLFMFTYQSTSFDMTGFILVISASVITGLRWSTAQLTLQKEELGKGREGGRERGEGGYTEHEESL